MKSLSPKLAEDIAKARENLQRIDGCKRHRFEGDIVPLAKVTCLECGGTMDLSKLSYYISGYTAAGSDPADIWKEWAEKHYG